MGQFFLLFLSILTRFAAAERLEIVWSRPRVSRAEFSNIISSGEDFLRLHKFVRLDLCGNRLLSSAEKSANITIEWSFYQRTNSAGQKVFLSRKVTENCRLDWIAPTEGNFAVRSVLVMNGSVKAAGVAEFNIKDVWLVVMGDSYLSGEGCPNVRRKSSDSPAVWIESNCHRSNNSFAFLTYQKLVDKYPKVGFLLSFTACSGASVAEGLMGEFKFQRPQIDVLNSILTDIRYECPQGCKTRPDLLLLSVGANDLQFGRLAESLLIGEFGQDESLLAEIPGRLDSLRLQLANLSDLLSGANSSLNLPSDRILFVDYFDPIVNFHLVDSGSCEDFGEAKLVDLLLARQLVVRPFFHLITNVTAELNWISVKNVGANLDANGICTPVRENALVANVVESLTIQADPHGAFHPNCRGQRASAELLFPIVDKYLHELNLIDV